MKRWPGRIILALVLVLITVLLTARLLAPRLEHFRPQLEQALSQRLGLPVRIQGLGMDWQGWGPVLALEGLSLQPPGGGAALVSVSRAQLALDPWASLGAGGWNLDHLRLEGLRLVLERRPDGRIVLLEPDRSDRPLDPQVLVRLLLAIDTLDLTGAELLLRPGAGQPPLVLRPLTLSLRREGGYHRLGLTARLPDGLEGEVRAAARLRPRGEGGLEGDFYLQVPRLRAAGALALARQLGRHPPLTVEGELDLELWGELAGWTPHRLVGRTTLADVALSRVPRLPAPPLPDLTGTFRLTRAGDQWLLGGDWRTSRGAALALDLAWGRQPPALALVGRELPLEIVQSLTPLLGEAAGQPLARLQPAGRLAALALVLHGPDRYRLTGRLRDLTFAPLGRIPGLTGLTADLTLDPRGGRLTLAGAPFTLTGGALATSVTLLPGGALEWQHNDTGLTLTPVDLTLVNGDLALALGGQVQLPAGEGLRLDLTADFRLADLARLGPYLPVRVMNPNLVNWLGTALVAGRVPQGRLVFQGRPGDFPFEQQPGQLRVQLEVDDVTLAYNREWPPLRDLQARLEIHNSTLTLRASRGRLMETVQLAGVEAVIPDLAQAVLDVRGRAAGPGSQMLAFVEQSPLWQRLGDALGRLVVSGDTTLDLHLTVPLDRSPLSVAGTVGFDGNRVTVAGGGVELERVRGGLDFTEQGVSARDVALIFRGSPARLAIDSRPGATQFRLEGNLDPRALGGWAQPYLSGRAPARVVLMVPNRGGPLTLAVDSTLAGMAVNLPPPLGKPAEPPRPVAARARIGASRLDLELDYGEQTRAALAFQGLGERVRLERGELRINAGPARLPDQPGLDLIARLGEVRWPLGLPGGGEAGEGDGLPPWLDSLDLRAARLVAGGYRLNGVVARGTNRNGELELELAGEAVAGRLRLPAEPSPGNPVTVNLERLYLERAPAAPGSEGGQPPDPRRLPPLALDVADLRLEGQPLGGLDLDLQPVADGVRLDDLHLESPLHDLVVRGQWQAEGSSQSTRLNLEFQSHDLGDSLTRLGLEPGLEAGEADLSARLQWPGPLTGPDLGRLAGEGTLSVGAGRLSRLEPGVGRVMGLFSLASLTRRLALDFSDLFREGLAFDSITGSFTLKEGDLETDNLVMEGPAADVVIQGRIGLGARDQGLQVTVLPQIGGVLPVAGALAGGPAVGAALFLAEQLLKEDIGAITRYRYRVTGTWEEPLVEVLERPLTPRSRPPTVEFGDR